jgi:hypothetical protein
MGAATTQQIMGIIIGASTGSPSGAYHIAFLLPVVFLAAAIVLFLPARDYTER